MPTTSREQKSDSFGVGGWGGAVTVTKKSQLWCPASRAPPGSLQGSRTKDGCQGIPGCEVLPWAGGRTPLDLRPLVGQTGLAWLRKKLEKGAEGTGLEAVSQGEGPVQKFRKMTVV